MRGRKDWKSQGSRVKWLFQDSAFHLWQGVVPKNSQQQPEYCLLSSFSIHEVFLPSINQKVFLVSINQAPTLQLDPRPCVNCSYCADAPLFSVWASTLVQSINSLSLRMRLRFLYQGVSFRWDSHLGKGEVTVAMMQPHVRPSLISMSNKLIIRRSILKENNSFGSRGSLLSKILGDTK